MSLTLVTPTDMNRFFGSDTPKDSHSNETSPTTAAASSLYPSSDATSQPGQLSRRIIRPIPLVKHGYLHITEDTDALIRAFKKKCEVSNEMDTSEKNPRKRLYDKISSSD